MKQNFLGNVFEFSLFLSYFCLWRSSRCVKSVNSARSSQKVENCTWNFSRCVGFFKEKFFFTFSWYFQIRTHFPQHTTKPTNENYFDMDASEKTTFVVWITNLRQRSSNNLSKLVLCTKACRTVVWLFLKITLDVTIVFFGRFTRDFPNTPILTNKKMDNLIRVIFRNPRASSCHQKLCLVTSNGSLQNLCLRFLISQTHRENDFFVQKWTSWYRAFSHILYFKRKKSKLSRFPILISKRII